MLIETKTADPIRRCKHKGCNKSMGGKGITKEYCSKHQFEHGKVFVLDMSLPMEEWHWELDNRGD
ncbi:MAG: hypothetical protein PVH73_01590 [Candidatus Bathyarchaeota archaeon]